MRPSLAGEVLKVYSDSPSTNITWSKFDVGNILSNTWYKTQFATPDTSTIDGDSVVLIDMSGMNRGQLYVNGYSLGRYWLISGPTDNRPTQRAYHIPVDYLNEVGGKMNNLVIFEVLGDVVDPTKIAIQISYMKKGNPQEQQQGDEQSYATAIVADA